MSGAHIVENMNTENTNISRTTASTPPPPQRAFKICWRSYRSLKIRSPIRRPTPYQNLSLHRILFKILRHPRKLKRRSKKRGSARSPRRKRRAENRKRQFNSKHADQKSSNYRKRKSNSACITKASERVRTISASFRKKSANQDHRFIKRKRQSSSKHRAENRKRKSSRKNRSDKKSSNYRKRKSNSACITKASERVRTISASFKKKSRIVKRKRKSQYRFIKCKKPSNPSEPRKRQSRAKIRSIQKVRKTLSLFGSQRVLEFWICSNNSRNGFDRIRSRQILFRKPLQSEPRIKREERRRKISIVFAFIYGEIAFERAKRLLYMQKPIPRAKHFSKDAKGGLNRLYIRQKNTTILYYRGYGI
nr:M-protein - Helicobacter pylori (strain 26695) [Helicobacter pylori]